MTLGTDAEPQDGRFAGSIDDLERSTQVGAADLVEEHPDSVTRDAALFWDEDRRQNRLAGG